MTGPTEAEAPSRLDRLLPLLEADPSNLALLADAAETALAEDRPEKAADLFDRYRAIAPLPPREANLAGLAALQSRRYDRAAELFAELVDAGIDDAAVRFNLAWASAMDKRFDRSLELLDDDLCRALPQAAMLRVQLLHDRGEFDEAAARARDYVEIHPSYAPLMAVVSVLALDVEDEALAAACAAKGGEHPDALTTLGTLALGDERATEALALFDRALDRNSQVPRAWVGRGLARLMTGQSPDAAADIDRGAEMFGDHLGSWIAAGWAHFVNKDLVSARARFEKALELDDTFAESHGSLAVLDLLEGNVEGARDKSEIALRLDRQCYSAALARSLLAAGAGDEATARRIYEAAVNTPVDGSGRTIGQALAKLGMRMS
ncbi:MAG TPA: tetratricopeptide repeat protein [Allosphingosinicella sp.]|nr:tetratricopeptide repeat protein [Allosphingosinicella sp.]